MTSANTFLHNYEIIAKFVNSYRDAKITANAATGQQFEYLANKPELELWCCVFLQNIPQTLSVFWETPDSLVEIANSYHYDCSFVEVVGNKQILKKQSSL